MKSYNSNEVCLKQGKKNVIIRDWRWGKEMDVFLCVCIQMSIKQMVILKAKYLVLYLSCQTINDKCHFAVS